MHRKDHDAARVHDPRRTLTIVTGAVLVVALVGGAWWLGRRGSAAGASNRAAAATAQPFAATKQVVSVTKGSMADTVSADGTVAAAQTDDQSFSSSGTVTAVDVKAGDTVKAGEVLASIDAADLQAAVVSSASTLADAKAKLADDEDASASSAQLAADATSVTSASDALADAEQALQGANLVATFSGTVASVDLTVGEALGSSGAGATTPTGSGSGSGLSAAASSSSSNASANGASNASSSSSTSAQIEVVSTGRYTVDLAVDASDIDSVKVGQSVALTVTTASSSASNGGGFGGFGGFAARNQSGASGSAATGSSRSSGGSANASSGATATGKVTAVSRVASASSGVATYTVGVGFDASANDFYVGSTVSGVITTASRTNVVQVPSRAVTTANGASTVTLALDGTTGGRTRTQSVTTGVTINGETEVVSGVQAGQKVIVEGPGGFGGAGGGFPGGATNGSSGSRTNAGQG